MRDGLHCSGLLRSMADCDNYAGFNFVRMVYKIYNGTFYRNIWDPGIDQQVLDCLRANNLRKGGAYWILVGYSQ